MMEGKSKGEPSKTFYKLELRYNNLYILPAASIPEYQMVAATFGDRSSFSFCASRAAALLAVGLIGR